MGISPTFRGNFTCFQIQKTCFQIRYKPDFEKFAVGRFMLDAAAYLTYGSDNELNCGRWTSNNMNESWLGYLTFGEEKPRL